MFSEKHALQVVDNQTLNSFEIGFFSGIYIL